MQTSSDVLNQYSVWIELVKVLGIIVTGVISILTLRITRTVHTLTNSNMQEMKRDNETLRVQLGISRENAATAAAHHGQEQPSGAADAAASKAELPNRRKKDEKA